MSAVKSLMRPEVWTQTRPERETQSSAATGLGWSEVTEVISSASPGGRSVRYTATSPVQLPAATSAGSWRLGAATVTQDCVTRLRQRQY